MSGLFLDQQYKLEFSKIAMPVKLSDSPEAWQREIASEIYKQVPYLGDYAVNVIIDRVDAERGFAFGSAQVTSKSESPKPDQKELPSIRIPVIVKDRMLAPMDTFMDGEGVYPLTEKRVREKLFRSSTFEPSSRKPTDQGMVDQLYPPMRTNYGMGSVGSDTMGMGKTASKKKKAANSAEAGRQAYIRGMKAEASANPEMSGTIKGASLVESIASTIPEVEADELVDAISNDMALKVAASRNPVFAKLAMAIAVAPRVGVDKTAAALVSSIKPTVVQLQKLASGNFSVKWANASAFAPQQGTVDLGQANSMAGTDLGNMQPGQTVTVGTEKAKKDSLMEEAFVQIQDPGHYKVVNADTNEHLAGLVMPVVDFEQQPLELFVFSCPQGYAVQDEIAGCPVGGTSAESAEMAPKMVELMQAQGDGVPVFVVNGKMKCLLPMTIQNMSQDPEGMTQIQGQTLFGEPITLTPSPGIQAIQRMGDFEYAVPDFVKWYTFEGPALFLAKTPKDIDNISQGQQAPSTVSVGSTGQGEFSMEGQPLAKVAKTHKQFLKHAEAEFLLVAMGVNPFAAREVLKTAEKSSGYVKLAGLRAIVPLASVHAEMVKKASYTLARFPYHLKVNLVKEAATLEDADTADKVLALNFLNPENIHTFAGYLPELDAASQKLAETLVATRLGMSSMDEGAIERSMRGIESVIEGLKALPQQNEM
jgi:hypothetical protein